MLPKITSIGDPAPFFTCSASNGNKDYNFSSAAGRYVVISFFGSQGFVGVKETHTFITKDLRKFFDDVNVCFYGVITKENEQSNFVHSVPGVRFFWDFDERISKLYKASINSEYKPFTLVLDPMLRIISFIPIEDFKTHNLLLEKVLSRLPKIDAHAGVTLSAPVLILPRVFEPDFCKELINLYKKHGGEESGFMNQKGGKTFGVYDKSRKIRKDFNFEEQPEFDELRKAIIARITKRLVPEISSAFQFNVTRIERFIISFYDGMEGGFFARHRDNTTKATAHRKFACSINLNAEEYEGGDLRFPEFGSKTYRAPTGGAVVFSCSLLHEATKVTKGDRYAFLPFFYDEEGAKIRKANLEFLSEEKIRI